jgi:hypothetical protein
MTEEHRETADHEQVLAAGARLGPRRKRLQWAVQFAQEPLDQLSPGRWYDLRRDLKGFLSWGPGISGPDVELPTDQEIREIQQDFREIIAKVWRGESVWIGRYDTEIYLMPIKGKLHLIEDKQLITLSDPRQARYVFALLLDHVGRDFREAGYDGPIIKACRAPKPRVRTGEDCGRWFVGRPNQVYCSPLCQNRASTRSFRADQRRKRRRRT